MKVTVRIEGGAELQRKLRALGRTVERQVAYLGLNAGARVLVKGAKARVAVRTGKLKNNIRYGRTADEAEPSPHPRVFVGPVPRLSWRAEFLEDGTEKMPAEPFLLPTLDQDGEAAARAVGETLGREVEKRARG